MLPCSAAHSPEANGGVAPDKFYKDSIRKVENVVPGSPFVVAEMISGERSVRDLVAHVSQLIRSSEFPSVHAAPAPLEPIPDQMRSTPDKEDSQKPAKSLGPQQEQDETEMEGQEPPSGKTPLHRQQGTPLEQDRREEEENEERPQQQQEEEEEVVVVADDEEEQEQTPASPTPSRKRRRSQQRQQQRQAEEEEEKRADDEEDVDEQGLKASQPPAAIQEREKYLGSIDSLGQMLGLLSKFQRGDLGALRTDCAEAERFNQREEESLRAMESVRQSLAVGRQALEARRAELEAARADVSDFEAQHARAMEMEREEDSRRRKELQEEKEKDLMAVARLGAELTALAARG